MPPTSKQRQKPKQKPRPARRSYPLPVRRPIDLATHHHQNFPPEEKAMNAPPENAKHMVFAAFYGISHQTVRVWQRKGAPLHRPEEMIEWWSSAFPGRYANPGIYQAIAKVKGSTPIAEEPPLPMRRTEAPAGMVGFEKTLVRMEREEAVMHLTIQDLRSAGKHEDAAVLAVEWRRMAAALSHADTRHIRTLLHKGDLLPRERVETEYAAVIGHFPEVLRAEIKAARTLLDPQPPAGAWEAQVDAILDDIFRTVPAKLVEAAFGPTSL